MDVVRPRAISNLFSDCLEADVFICPYHPSTNPSSAFPPSPHGNPHFPSSHRLRSSQPNMRQAYHTKMNIPWNTSSHCTSVSLPARISPLTPALAPSAIGLHSPSLAIFISIPRRTGSPIPKLRRRAVILNSSCVDCQAARRASRGWLEAGLDVWEADERDERRVS